MVIAEKWTKTSSPPSRSMKPYPFSFENHFTVPSANTSSLQKNDGPGTEPPTIAGTGGSLAQFFGDANGRRPSQSRCGNGVLEHHGDRHRSHAAGNGGHVGRALHRSRVDVAEHLAARLVAVHPDVDHRCPRFDHVRGDQV